MKINCLAANQSNVVCRQDIQCAHLIILNLRIVQRSLASRNFQQPHEVIYSPASIVLQLKSENRETE